MIKDNMNIQGRYNDNGTLIIFSDGKFIPELSLTKENENDTAFWLWVQTMLTMIKMYRENKKLTKKPKSFLKKLLTSGIFIFGSIALLSFILAFAFKIIPFAIVGGLSIVMEYVCIGFIFYGDY